MTTNKYTSNFIYGKIHQLIKTDDQGENYSFKLRKSSHLCEHGSYEQIEFWLKEDNKQNYFFCNDGQFCFFNFADKYINNPDKCTMSIPDYAYCSLKIGSLLLYEFYCYRERHCTDLDLGKISVVGGDAGSDNENRKLKLYQRFGYKFDEGYKCKHGNYDSSIEIIIDDPKFGFDIELCKDDSFE